jgi:hypothetical protein
MTATTRKITMKVSSWLLLGAVATVILFRVTVGNIAKKMQ